MVKEYIIFKCVVFVRANHNYTDFSNCEIYFVITCRPTFSFWQPGRLAVVRGLKGPTMKQKEAFFRIFFSI